MIALHTMLPLHNEMSKQMYPTLCLVYMPIYIPLMVPLCYRLIRRFLERKRNNNLEINEDYG